MTDSYKPLTIHDMIKVRMKDFVEQPVQGTKMIDVYALNERVKARYNNIINCYGLVATPENDIIIIDVTNWLCIGRTIKGKRADKLKTFCKQHENTRVAVIVYNDTNPAAQVIDCVRELLPKLRMQHFSTCNNIAGQNRALWFVREDT